MGHVSVLSKSCKCHSTLENVTQRATTVPELLWVTTEAGQMAAVLREAAGHNVKLASITPSKIETKQSTRGRSPYANIFVYL